MPPTTRIRLRIEQRQADTPCCYREPTDPLGTSRLFPLLRLATLARVERNGRRSVGFENALIDTGAWITAIETVTWRAFDRLGLIEHLPFTGIAPSPSLIGGASSAYRLGRLWITLHELQPPVPGQGLVSDWLPAVPVVAQLLLDPACKLPSPFLLGLHLSVLDGRRLTREPRPPLPGPIPSNRSTDCGPWFSQDWFLETV